MSRKITFIVGFTELNAPVGLTSIATNIAEAVNNDTDSFTVVNNIGQTVASVTSVVPILRPFNIQSNIYAATTAFLKIVVDLKEGKEVKAGDVFSLVGNLAGVVGTMALFSVGGGPVVLWAGAIGVAASAASVWTNYEMIRDGLITPIYNNLWSANPAADYKLMYITADGSVVDRNTLRDDFNDKILSGIITETGVIWSEADYSEVYPGENSPEPDDEDPGDGYNCDEYHE